MYSMLTSLLGVSVSSYVQYAHLIAWCFDEQLCTVAHLIAWCFGEQLCTVAPLIAWCFDEQQWFISCVGHLKPGASINYS